MESLSRSGVRLRAAGRGWPPRLRARAARALYLGRHPLQGRQRSEALGPLRRRAARGRPNPWRWRSSGARFRCPRGRAGPVVSGAARRSARTSAGSRSVGASATSCAGSSAEASARQQRAAPALPRKRPSSAGTSRPRAPPVPTDGWRTRRVLRSRAVLEPEAPGARGSSNRLWLGRAGALSRWRLGRAVGVGRSGAWRRRRGRGRRGYWSRGRWSLG